MSAQVQSRLQLLYGGEPTYKNAMKQIKIFGGSITSYTNTTVTVRFLDGSTLTINK